MNGPICVSGSPLQIIRTGMHALSQADDDDDDDDDDALK